MSTSIPTGARTIDRADPNSADAVAVLRRYYVDIVGRYWRRAATSAEVDAAIADEPSDDLVAPTGLFLLARIGGRVAGCAGLRVLSAETVELTRVYVDPEFRGSGLSGAVLDQVEREASALGARAIRLDVRADLVQARALYARQGYREIPAYNESRYADHWFEKHLPDNPPG